MKKFFSPKLEVIHFNTEDVIVTSGFGVYGNLTKGTPYWTKNSELLEYSRLDYNNLQEKYYSIFTFDGNSIVATGKSLQGRDINDESGVYAFFKENYADTKGIWWTDGKTKSQYTNLSSLPSN